MSDSPDKPPSGDQSMHEQASPLLEGYVLDALEPDETAIVNAHLDEGCIDCESEVGVLRQVLGWLPLGAPLYEAGAGLKQRVFRAIDEPDQPERKRGPARPSALLAGVRPWSTRLAATAAGIGLLALGGLIGWNVVLQTEVDNLQSDNSVLRTAVQQVVGDQDVTLAIATAASDVATVASDDATIARELAGGVDSRMTAALFSLSGPSTQRLLFNGTDEAPAASARLLWDPSEGVFIVVASGLAPTRTDGSYVLWADGEDGPVRMAMFYVDESGNGVGHGKMEFPVDANSPLSVSYENGPSPEKPSKAPVLTAGR